MENRGRVSSEEEQAFLPKAGIANNDTERQEINGDQKMGAVPPSPRGWTSWLRLLLELGMALTIAYLIIFKPFVVTRDERLLRTPVPQFPRKLYTFKSNDRYAAPNMWFNESLTLQKLHNWIELSSDSRGYVVLPDDWRKYDLPEPYSVAIDRHHDGEGYMMSVFHQLHCFSYILEHLQQGYAGGELTEEISHHLTHCTNYLRQSIMCCGDTTLEGKTEEGPGEGSQHECVDYDALLSWANEHHAMKWRNGLLPGESIL